MVYTIYRVVGGEMLCNDDLTLIHVVCAVSSFGGVGVLYML